MRMVDPDRYDLITLEPPPIAFAGVSALYSKEFYALAKSRLASGGFLTQWLPAYQVPGEVAKAMVRAFIEIFPQAIMVSGFDRHLMLMGRKDAAISVDPNILQRRIDENASLRKDLASISLATAKEFIGTFTADQLTLSQAVEGSLVVSDDYPLLEFDSTAVFSGTRVPREFFNVTRVTQWCPTCFAGGRPVAAVNGLDRYLALLATYYASDLFLAHWQRRSAAQNSISFSMDTSVVVETIEQSGYLQNLLPFVLEQAREGR